MIHLCSLTQNPSKSFKRKYFRRGFKAYWKQYPLSRQTLIRKINSISSKFNKSQFHNLLVKPLKGSNGSLENKIHLQHHEITNTKGDRVYFQGKELYLLHFFFFLKWCQLLKERICSCRSKFFPSKVHPFLEGLSHS